MPKGRLGKGFKKALKSWQHLYDFGMVKLENIPNPYRRYIQQKEA